MSSFEKSQCDEFNGPELTAEEMAQFWGDEEASENYDDGQPDEYTEWQDYMGGDDYPEQWFID